MISIIFPLERHYPTEVEKYFCAAVEGKVMELADEVEYTFSTFGGTVPGNHPDIVTVHSSFTDIYAMTNEKFLAFVKANPQWTKSRVSRLYANNNYLRQWAGDFTIGNKKIYTSLVTNISWFAANAYCKWKGKRMPTMNEWEYAGSAAPAGMKKGQKLSTIILDWYGRPTPPVLPPVGSTFKNSFGVYDMHGLIWEWVYDFNRIITGGNAGEVQKNCFALPGPLV